MREYSCSDPVQQIPRIVRCNTCKPAKESVSFMPLAFRNDSVIFILREAGTANEMRSISLYEYSHLVKPQHLWYNIYDTLLFG